MSDYKSLALTGPDSEGKFAKVSPKHYERLNKTTWNLNGGRIYSIVDGKQRLLNVYIWFLEHGSYPSLKVDHKNRDVFDNTIENLRLATSRQNRANSTLSTRNKAGCKNVTFNTGRKTWEVRIAGKFYGYFQTIDEAVEIAKKKSVLVFEEFSNCEQEDTKLRISRKFDAERKINSDLDYKTFLAEEIAKIPVSANLAPISKDFKNVKEKWEEVKDSGLFCKIEMTSKEALNGEFTIVDKGHYEQSKTKSITLNSGSPTIYIDDKSMMLHAYILHILMKQLPNNKETVDHKNRVYWDNSGINLRNATPAQQVANRGIPSNNTSGAKGVKFRDNHWEALICVNKVQCQLGTFVDKRYATLIYDITSDLVWGTNSAPNYTLRGATSAFDFGEESITVKEFEEIVSNAARNTRLTNRNKMIPTFVSHLKDLLKTMKEEAHCKRSTAEAELTEAAEVLNSENVTKKVKPTTLDDFAF